MRVKGKEAHALFNLIFTLRKFNIFKAKVRQMFVDSDAHNIEVDVSSIHMWEEWDDEQQCVVTRSAFK